jgi:phage tail sheath protein FI
MPEYLAPGVYIEEISVGPKPIEGVSTSTAAFVGIAEKGPLNEPTLITNFGDFTRTFGNFLKESYLAYAVYGFFGNGGKRCYVVRVASSKASAAYADFFNRNNVALLRISASSPGAWGKNVQVDIQESSLGNTSLYQSALEASASAAEFKPKSKDGLKAGDKVKLSDGFNESAVLTVQSIEADGRVMLDGNLGGNFPVETSRAMIVLKADAPQPYLLSVVTTTGFAAGSLVAFREAGQDAVYVQLTEVKPSEKRIYWTGEFKDENGSAATNNEVQGANLVDVKRVTLKFEITGANVTADQISKANLKPSRDVARIRKGDTITFGTGKTAETVTVIELDTPTLNTIYVRPSLKNTYPITASVSVLTTPKTSLFTIMFNSANTVPGNDQLETMVKGFAIGDTLVFQGGAGGDQALNVVNMVSDTKLKLSNTPASDHNSVVVQLKNQATGVVVDDPTGFQANDLVEVTSAGGTTKVLRLAKVEGNRLIFTANPKWSGDVSSAEFLARQWQTTRLNTLEFRIRAKYEKDQTMVEEVFDRLSLDPNSKHYVAKEGVINKSSTLITVDDQRPKPVSAPTGYLQIPKPTTEPKPLDQGGEDGLAGLTASDYIGQYDLTTGKRTGIVALEPVDEVNILCIPDIMKSFGGGTSPDDVELIQKAMIDHCARLKDRFAILDPIKNQTVQQVQAWRNDNLDSKYAALYYPWIKVQDPIKAENGSIRLVPPSGHIAGIYARTDIERGVHKAPANEVIRGVIELERKITMGEQEILNPDGINCIRQFPGRGIRVWGARTVSSDPEWKYVNVRRLFLYIEESIEEGTQWVVFEPNAEPLWQRLIRTVSDFLTRVWRDGALMGTTAEEAFFVKCDRTTMTQDDINNGRLICLIGIAPVRPAEFVIFRIHQWQGGSEITE